MNLNKRNHFFLLYSSKASKMKNKYSCHVTTGRNQGEALFFCWIPSLNKKLLRINELKRPNTFFGSVFWIVFEEGKVWWLRFNKKYPKRSACFVDLHHHGKHSDAALNLNTRLHFFFGSILRKVPKRPSNIALTLQKEETKGKRCFCDEFHR